MKVFNLQCGLQHSFEGWFASEPDYQQQLEKGLVSCPLCGDATIVRLPSAPRLNLSGAAAPQSPDQAAAPSPPQNLQAAWMSMVRHVMANTVDVGSQFAQEARKIHYGEAEQRAIRGQASRDEALELLDEGIEVLPLPVPEAAKGPTH